MIIASATISAQVTKFPKVDDKTIFEKIANKSGLFEPIKEKTVARDSVKSDSVKKSKPIAAPKKSHWKNNFISCWSGISRTI